ncbi:Dyp-type peroxidase [Kaarinaea lacus]
MESLTQSDFEDIQGLVVRGYKHLEAASYVMLKVVDSTKAKKWCGHLIPKITNATDRHAETALNIAWTCQGLEAIRFSSPIMHSFSDEFRSGMITEHKRRILGDQGDNAPENWRWAGPNNQPVHVLLLMYARDPAKLNELYLVYARQFAQNGLEEIYKLTSDSLLDGKEHFGFKDGIAQPYVAQFDSSSSGKGKNPVALGEILLGYKNAYGRYTQRPLIDIAQDPNRILPTDNEDSHKRDLGKNGTYLVFRQLEQDVQRFWSFMTNQTSQQDTSHAIYLASKMVGRWPSGAPLVKAPDEDKPEMRQQDDFLYHHSDASGSKCPLGAHIRRTNPRDSLEPEPGSKKSIEFSNRHRILRRGRTYGQPFTPSVNPLEFIEHLEQPYDGERGLLFIGLNANIGRQFEFVQHTWSNNPNFNGLYQDPDPIIGIRHANSAPHDSFTIQKQPLRHRICNLPEFVTVRGGAYFFLPGIAALNYIATAPEE